MKRKKVVTSSQTLLLVGKNLSQINEEASLQAEIDNVKDEIERIDHASQCEECMIDMVLSIERYAGRSLPWYLNLSNGEFEGEDYAECPKIQDYELGYYGKDNQPGTRQFIKDRLTWAHREYSQKLEEFKEELENVKKVKVW